MVMFQMRAEPDVSRPLVPTLDVLEKEKSSTPIEPDANHADHTPEPKEVTPFASQTHAARTKSSPG
jgi:hypothetical protein